MKKQFYFFVIVIMAATSLVSCTKSATNTKPAAQTISTPSSNEQLEGAAGDVIYSKWKVATNFRDTTIDATYLNACSLAAPSIKSSTLKNSAILVYLTIGTLGVEPLPYTSYASGVGSTISFIPAVKSILITRFTFDNSGSAGFNASIQYRYVIIPGTIQGKSVHPDFKDYKAVCKFYGIPE